MAHVAARRGSPTTDRQLRRAGAHRSQTSARRAPADGDAPAARPLDAATTGDYLTRLYRVARALTGSVHEAEDLVQDTYARVLARPRMVREDDFGYLVTALRHTFIDGRRRRRLQVLSLDDLTVEPAARSSRGRPEQEVMAREVYRAIAELPAAYRDVVAAIDLGGLSYAEAAQALGVRPGTVMSRLYRARAQLASRFGDV